MFEASVIVSTYNRLNALKLVLEGLRRQSCGGFEVIVADDGSTKETRDFLAEFKFDFPFPIKHVWQPDDGFKKARILNQAIAASESPYMIFTDGDCIPHKHFVKAHMSLAEPGRFIISRSVLLGEKFSRRINTSYIKSGKLDWFNVPMFLDYIFGQTRFFEYSVYLRCNAMFALVSRLKKSKSMFGGNFSAWKDDLIKVNGFSEEFVKWGNEDGELGYRLLNSGLSPKAALSRAINFHYYHDRSFRTRNAENVDRATRSREGDITRCESGLDQYL